MSEGSWSDISHVGKKELRRLLAGKSPRARKPAWIIGDGGSIESFHSSSSDASSDSIDTLSLGLAETSAEEAAADKAATDEISSWVSDVSIAGENSTPSQKEGSDDLVRVPERVGGEPKVESSAEDGPPNSIFPSNEKIIAPKKGPSASCLQYANEQLNANLVKAESSRYDLIRKLGTLQPKADYFDILLDKFNVAHTENAKRGDELETENRVLKKELQDCRNKLVKALDLKDSMDNTEVPAACQKNATHEMLNDTRKATEEFQKTPRRIYSRNEVEDILEPPLQSGALPTVPRTEEERIQHHRESLTDRISTRGHIAKKFFDKNHMLSEETFKIISKFKATHRQFKEELDKLNKNRNGTQNLQELSASRGINSKLMWISSNQSVAASRCCFNNGVDETINHKILEAYNSAADLAVESLRCFVLKRSLEAVKPSKDKVANYATTASQTVHKESAAYNNLARWSQMLFARYQNLHAEHSKCRSVEERQLDLNRKITLPKKECERHLCSVHES